QFLAATKEFADLSIAAVLAHAGRDQITQSRQSGERLRLSAEGNAKPCHLRQAARQQGGLGVVTEAQPVADAGGNADDILQCSAEFDTNHIEIGVNTEAIRAEVLLNPASQFQVAAGSDQRGRQTATDFLRMARPT